MKQKCPNRYNKLQKPFLDVAHYLIMGTKKWQMSILGESKHLNHFEALEAVEAFPAEHAVKHLRDLH